MRQAGGVESELHRIAFYGSGATPDLSERPRFYEPTQREQRYAADFPAALFPGRRKDAP